LGVPLARPAAHPRRTVAAMRLCVAAPSEVRPALARDLYRSYWVEGADIADPQILAPIASRHGVPIAAVDDPSVKDALFAATAEAAERGVFGVPTFAVGDRLWWGVDRIPVIECALGACLPPPDTGRIDGEYRFFHDFASPFSYLASTQVGTAERVPILLGALFRELGTPEVPLFTFSEAKRRWFVRDAQEWASYLGVPFQFPEAFPLRTVLPLRVAIVEPSATDAIYRAAWGEGKDIGDARVLEPILDRAGFDGRALLDRADDPAIKDALRANTSRAKAAGVFGVPTFQVGSTLFWGQDRLGHLRAALEGWRPLA
jgi:2-hydroxychromene-2-carboxylate isomerase